jgi:hypothetical protein
LRNCNLRNLQLRDLSIAIIAECFHALQNTGIVRGCWQETYLRSTGCPFFIRMRFTACGRRNTTPFSWVYVCPLYNRQECLRFLVSILQPLATGFSGMFCKIQPHFRRHISRRENPNSSARWLSSWSLIFFNSAAWQRPPSSNFCFRHPACFNSSVTLKSISLRRHSCCLYI